MTVLIQDHPISALRLSAGRLRALAIVPLWVRRAHTRRQLRGLDDRLLADIGISEGDRRRECARRFWEGSRSRR
jgi:uncharacterized protein YjiS (DUF1127 family)